MNQRSIVLFVVLFVLVVAGMFTFAYLKRTEQAAPVVEPGPVVDAASTSVPYMSRVDAKHYIIDGTHTFAGIIDMPTPCHLLEATARVEESMPEQIVIDFTVINNAEVCAQVVTPQRFKVEAAASPQAKIRATWAGVPIELNLIPAGPGESPDDFELFIKG